MSAARMMISEEPRLRVLVAGGAVSIRRGGWDGGARTFVCALLQHPIVTGLLDQVEDGLGEGLVGEGPRWVD